MTYDYTRMPAPGDTLSCPKCRAIGGPGGMIRVRGVMTDREYNDRRCNKCGHKWIVGDSLELPFEPPDMPATPTKEEPGTEVSNYDFGDGFEREDESVPF